MRLGHIHHGGDTLIEVLVSLAVFAIIMVGAQNIMNQTLYSEQRTLYFTLSREEMDSQIATLRYLQNAYLATFAPSSTVSDYPLNSAAREYASIIQYVKTANLSSASQFASGVCPTTPPAGAFILNARKATAMLQPGNIITADNYAKVTYDSSDNVVNSQGLWIEGVRYSSNAPYVSSAGYVDFHVMACFYVYGQSVPVTLGTIVRLYDPH